eukprot:scaffold105600_cov42-Prasinocladus_malaysianus.AAC.1
MPPGYLSLGLLLGLLAVAPVDSKDSVEQLEAADLGFTIVRTEYLEDFGYDATLYRHIVTGAEVFAINAPDPNSAFGVVLKTPITNNRGAPHILEHAVLQGSENYPTQHPG